MRKIFKKTTQNKEQGDYVLRRPRNSIRENYLVSMFEFCRLVSLGWDPSARTEADEPSRDQKIFQQKNTCDSCLRRNDRSRAFTRLVDFHLTKMRNIFAWKQSELLPRRKFTTGFTLVETLVAISILMLSVTGPLYYASESLKAATYARDQITAFYLAQDAFEQIRKIRDDNVYDSAKSWNYGLDGCEVSQSTCTVTGINDNFYIVNKISNPISDDWKYLYISDLGLYSHNTTGTKTIFKRSVKIQPNDGTNPDNIWEGVTEMKVTVLVEWNSRGTARSFTAYEFLRNFEDTI